METLRFLVGTQIIDWRQAEDEDRAVFLKQLADNGLTLAKDQPNEKHSGSCPTCECQYVAPDV